MEIDRFGGLFFMPFLALKDARNMPDRVIEQRPSLAQNSGKGGILMNKLVARLIDCGMTRKVALCMLRQFQDLREAERYVEQVEEASREPMDSF